MLIKCLPMCYCSHCGTFPISAVHGHANASRIAQYLEPRRNLVTYIYRKVWNLQFSSTGNVPLGIQTLASQGILDRSLLFSGVFCNNIQILRNLPIPPVQKDESSYTSSPRYTLQWRKMSEIYIYCIRAFRTGRDNQIPHAFIENVFVSHINCGP